MEQGQWPDWALVKLQECYIRGFAPEEAAALLGKSKDEVCEKALELGLVTAPRRIESPSTAPTTLEPFPRRFRLRAENEPALPGIFFDD